MGKDNRETSRGHVSQLAPTKIDGFIKIDLPWPAWTMARFKTKYYVDEDELLKDPSSPAWKPHSIFESRPSEIVFERADRRSAVIISDGEQSIGEAWLRLSITLQGKPLRFSKFCEMYRYRRGWRDKTLADMDGQPTGTFIMPSRESDVYCGTKKSRFQISLRTGNFVVKLSKIG